MFLPDTFGGNTLIVSCPCLCHDLQRGARSSAGQDGALDNGVDSGKEADGDGKKGVIDCSLVSLCAEHSDTHTHTLTHTHTHLLVLKCAKFTIIIIVSTQ